MKLCDLISCNIETLGRTGIDNPSLDARLLVAHALGLDRAALLSQSERDVTAAENVSIEKLIARRRQGESVARIIGYREFWGLDFGLNEATLEPRPDSETLIEAVVSQEDQKSTRTLKLLDLGTGTGCLLLALLHEMPNALGVGIDIAPRALEQATTNAKALGLDRRSLFHLGNWFDDVEGIFDIIISNPPYIPTKDIAKLQRDVRDFDPHRALDGGVDGLNAYRFLIPQLSQFLKPQGLVAFEVGQGQAGAVMDLLHKNRFMSIESHKDLGGIERCITGRLIG